MAADSLQVISIIVPTKDEAPEAVERLRRLAAAPGVELLVADAGGSSETMEAFRSIGARIVSGPGPRGARLAEAARQASGEILLFLHCDSDAPDNALEALEKGLSNGAVAGAFSLAYRDADARMRWIAWWANVRSRRLGLPFGDQGLFCRRDAYEKAGGFAPLPICDDVDLVRRLKRVGPLVIRPEKSVTSSRRYRQRGALRQVLRNWKVLAGYFLGVAPERLERWYNGR
jgi:hypothetical protein